MYSDIRQSRLNSTQNISEIKFKGLRSLEDLLQISQAK